MSFLRFEEFWNEKKLLKKKFLFANGSLLNEINIFYLNYLIRFHFLLVVKDF